PVVPEDVRLANEALKDALTYANIVVTDGKDDKTSYDRAISKLEEALAQNLKAADDRKQQVKDRLKELKDKLDAMSKGAAAVKEEWEQIRRDAETAIEEYKYKASAELVQAFLIKYKDSTNEDFRTVVADSAQHYYVGAWGARVQKHALTF